MAILNMQWVEFVVWTKKDISYQRILFNSVLWKDNMLPKLYAAKLRTTINMHNDQEYGKIIMTSHEIVDRDKAAKMLFNLYAELILYSCLNIVFY